VPFPLARRFQQICATFLAQVYAHEVVNDAEYAPLACVDDFPGIDQTRLAKLVGIDRTSAGQVVDKLEARGLVVRRGSKEDRRVRLLTATAKGRALRQRIRPQVLAAQDLMLAPLSLKERTLLMDLLVRVIEANEVHARPGAGRRPPSKKKDVATDGERDVGAGREKASSRNSAGKRSGRGALFRSSE
jgi:DNA-binding MarR family transcriptional regulator